MLRERQLLEVGCIKFEGRIKIVGVTFLSKIAKCIDIF